MSEENFEKRQRTIPEGLKPEEIKVLKEINKILDAYIDDRQVSAEEMINNQKIIDNFQKELKAKNINPYEYHLWHRLMGSSEIKSKLDLDDHAIEKKIKEIYAKYI